MMTAAQQKLKEKHGTPAEFYAACNMAYMQLFISWDELVEAVFKYRQEWDEAGNQERSGTDAPHARPIS